MGSFSSIKFYFNRLNIIILILLFTLLFYPKDLLIADVAIINTFVKTRIISLGILFLILRGLVHDYYSSRLTILFLIALILAPSLTFGQLVFVTLGGLLFFRLIKKI